jgi:hypothetical protein
MISADDARKCLENYNLAKVAREAKVGAAVVRRFAAGKDVKASNFEKIVAFLKSSGVA